jgi:hypothetical protein
VLCKGINGRISDGGAQYSVDIVVNDPTREVMENHRKMVVEMFEDHITKDGYSWSDLTPLPMPEDYKKHAWMA